MQNTHGDLMECAEALDNDGLSELSPDECDAAREIIRLCALIVENHGHEVE
jgi:hypothetical protein